MYLFWYSEFVMSFFILNTCYQILSIYVYSSKKLKKNFMHLFAIFPRKYFIWNAVICFTNDSFVFIFPKISSIFQCLSSYLFLFQNQIYIFLTDKQNIICITLFAFFLPPSFRKKTQNCISCIQELWCIYGKVFFTSFISLPLSADPYEI